MGNSDPSSRSSNIRRKVIAPLAVVAATLGASACSGGSEKMDVSAVSNSATTEAPSTTTSAINTTEATSSQNQSTPETTFTAIATTEVNNPSIETNKEKEDFLQLPNGESPEEYANQLAKFMQDLFDPNVSNDQVMQLLPLLSPDYDVNDEYWNTMVFYITGNKNEMQAEAASKFYVSAKDITYEEGSPKQTLTTDRTKSVGFTLTFNKVAEYTENGKVVKTEKIKEDSTKYDVVLSKNPSIQNPVTNETGPVWQFLLYS